MSVVGIFRTCELGFVNLPVTYFSPLFLLSSVIFFPFNKPIYVREIGRGVSQKLHKLQKHRLLIFLFS